MGENKFLDQIFLNEQKNHRFDHNKNREVNVLTDVMRDRLLRKKHATTFLFIKKEYIVSLIIIFTSIFISITYYYKGNIDFGEIYIDSYNQHRNYDISLLRLIRIFKTRQALDDLKDDNDDSSDLRPCMNALLFSTQPKKIILNCMNSLEKLVAKTAVTKDNFLIMFICMLENLKNNFDNIPDIVLSRQYKKLIIDDINKSLTTDKIDCLMFLDNYLFNIAKKVNILDKNTLNVIIQTFLIPDTYDADEIKKEKIKYKALFETMQILNSKDFCNLLLDNVDLDLYDDSREYVEEFSVEKKEMPDDPKLKLSYDLLTNLMIRFVMLYEITSAVKLKDFNRDVIILLDRYIQLLLNEAQKRNLIHI